MMTITLNLQPEEESILATQAEAQGVTVETILRRVIVQMPPPPSPVREIPEKNKTAIALHSLIVATENAAHLSRHVAAAEWRNIAP